MSPAPTTFVCKSSHCCNAIRPATPVRLVQDSPLLGTYHVLQCERCKQTGVVTA